ncbi:MAG: helix-turn-helix transcriptional regulator [Candidatus Omnitrophota bacterium]
MKTIAERIKQYREALPLSQSEFSKKTGLTPAAISQFESGEREPSLDSLRKLAEGLNVPVGYLVGEEADKEFLDEPELVAMFREMKKLKQEDKKKLQDLYKVFLQWDKDKSKK